MINDVTEIVVVLIVLMLILVILFFGIISIVWMEKRNRAKSHKKINDNVSKTNELFSNIIDELKKR